jgi:MazG family protein
MSSSQKATFEELVAVMDRLREPGGCPWDREQDWTSLRQYIIEEAYEVVEAIEHGAPEKVADECGDLLFQVIFLARIAKEQDLFDVYDTITAIRDKLVRRHPHVFGDVKAETAGDVVRNWEALKSQERKAGGEKSAVDGVPSGLPALMRCYKLGQKAARVGFDWADVSGVWDKVHEELGELKEAMAGDSAAETRHELGDVLFALTSLARFMEINPEDACREAAARFEERFRSMEARAHGDGVDFSSLDAAEMDRRWRVAKSGGG